MRKSIADRFNITFDELKSFGDINAKNLLSNIYFKNLVISRQKEKKEKYFKYVMQNVDLNEKFAFVDLNGSGKTLDWLAELINERKNIVIDTFYFRFQGDMQYCNKTNKAGFLNSLNYDILILELLCRTLHGQTIGYKEILAYLDGEVSIEEALDKLKQHTRNYAKRQLTWFRKNKKLNVGI